MKQTQESPAGDAAVLARIVVFAIGSTQETPNQAELKRVLEETADLFEELRQEHAAALEELAQLERWLYDQRRQQIVGSADQQHLSELSPASDINLMRLADVKASPEDLTNTRR